MTQDELMNLLTSLISGWENEVVEFKEANDNYPTDDIGKYFSALANEANLRGINKSWLIFGINNKTKNVVGSDYRRERARLNQLKMQITENSDPSVTFREIHELQHPDGRVVLFEIPPAPQGIPIAWKGHYYARSGESLVALNLDKLELIRRQGQQEDWSAQIVPGATVNDLDAEALQIARKGFIFKHANRFSEIEVNGWSLETFLDRAKVTRDGKITRTALLLLGKPESAHLLNPHPAQMTWKLIGEERAYEHFGPPFLLNSTELFKRIRNIQIRIVPDNSLLATEVAKYDRKVILEGLHNCIAHQDYTLNSRIIVTEYIDKLTLFNAGSFFEGDPDDYIYGEKTPSRYRNTMLATAMAELNMIDTMGYGIHDMFKKQVERGFPLQDYDKKIDSFSVTIYGHIIDNSYSTMLLQKTHLTPNEIILLDRIQKKLEISADGKKQLRAAKLIEGRGENIRIAKVINQVVSTFSNQPDRTHVLGSSYLQMGAQVEGSSCSDVAQVEGSSCLERAQVKSDVDKGSLIFGILQILNDNNSLSRAKIAGLNAVKVRTGNFVRSFKQLLKLGFIEPLERKSRSPKQVYRITDNGRRFLEDNKTNTKE